MAQWLKNLTGCLCILTILIHLIPNKKFSRYVRFYGGLIFFLVAAGPVWNLFAGEGELERVLQLSFLKDDYYDLESAVEGMAELKNERITDAYREEIRRQVGEIAAAYGIAASDIRLFFDKNDEYRLTGLSFSAASQTGEGMAGYDPPEQGSDRSATTGGAAGQEAQREALREGAVEDMRREIAGIYALDLSCIHVKREETKR